MKSSILAGLRSDFPLIKDYSERANPLTYLDNAASSQIPECTFKAINEYQNFYHSNVHRGIHQLSQQATDRYEAVREAVRARINAKNSNECIFLRGTTEAINLVAYSLSKRFFTSGDEIVLTAMEHHANIVPWVMLAKQHNFKIKVVPLKGYELDLGAFEELLTERTKLVACTHVSNVLGTINPIKEIVNLAHKKGALVLVDGCQAAPHLQIDVRDLGADFYTFSAHKMYGPTGVGVLYGKEEILNQMDHFLFGGDMVDTVSFDEIRFKPLPYKFEAGTPPILSTIGFGASIEFLNQINPKDLLEYESLLTRELIDLLKAIPEVKICGISDLNQLTNRIGVVSFTVENLHSHDVGAVLDQCGVAVRVGRHCAEPLLNSLGVDSTIRASLALYNSREDLTRLSEALKTAIEILSF